MSDWIHYIGKKYYTMNSFAKEAAQHGVTRRVSLNVAKRMSWGDRIYTAMLDGKTGVIFGSFIISKLTGLSTEVTTQLEKEYESKLVDEGGDIVLRGCGEYIEGDTHTIKRELPDIIDCLSQMSIDDKDIGNPMVGGLFQTASKIRLMDIPFRQGFRTIDAKALLHSASANGGRVNGQFYIQSNNARPLLSDHLKECGWVQAVENYVKKAKGRRKA